MESVPFRGLDVLKRELEDVRRALRVFEGAVSLVPSQVADYQLLEEVSIYLAKEIQRVSRIYYLRSLL